MDDILERFDAVADDYDDFTDRIPRYDVLTETIREILVLWGDQAPPRAVCELGCGTGRLAHWIADRFEPERYVGVDGSGEMIRRARDRFETAPTAVPRVEWKQTRFEEWRPEGTFDWIVSSLAVHHLEDPRKRDLLNRMDDALRPGGHVLLCDLVRRPGDLLDFYREIRRRRTLRGGGSEEAFERRWQMHVQNDVPADLDDLLDWFEGRGWEGVDCVWKDMNRVIVIGTRPPGED